MPATKIFKMSEKKFLLISDNYGGICLSCGKIQHDSVEPDARNYKCNYCEQHKVYGMEEALIMGQIEFKG